MQTDEEAEILRVVQELCQQLHPTQIRVVQASSHLEWDLGIGSLERAELIRRLEAALGRPLQAQPLFAAPRVRDLVAASQMQAGETLQLASGAPPVLPLPPFPDHAQTLMEAFHYQCQHQADRVLYFFEQEGNLERSLSPQELWQEAGQMAGALARLGVKPGHTVALMLPTGLPFVAGFLAILWLGAVPVPLYPPFRADQAEDYLKRQKAILENAQVRVLISFDRAWTITQLLQMQCPSLEQVVSAESLVGVEAPALYPGQADDLGLIQYTSGSTGQPKGVALTQANLLHNIRAYGKALQVNETDVCISWLPLYHDMGLIGTMLGSIYHGIPLVLMGPQDFLARPVRWLQALSRYHGTISPAPNFAYEICASRIPSEELQGLDLSHWRVALNGAEPIQPATIEKFSQRFEPYGFHPEAHFPAYGLAEAALAVAFSPLNRGLQLDRVDLTSLQHQGRAVPQQDGHPWVCCGYPLDGTELEIRDPAGQVLPPRHQGRLFFRSGSALQSYYRNPSATSEIKSSDGWVDTGDLAYLAEGQLYITGRAKDLIIKAGRNLYPQDVEAAAASVEGVRRGCVAAFAVAGPAGEKLVVALETRKPSPELIRQVEAEVARAVGVGPDVVLPLAPGSIPKTPSGKIRRAECRQWYLQGNLGRKTSPWKQALRVLRQVPLRNSLRGLFTGAALFTLLGIPALVVSQLSGSVSRRLLGSGARWILRLLRLPLEIEGEAYPGPCILVVNHCSLLDPVVVLASHPRPLLFLVAPWVYDHPILSRAMRKMGYLKVTRGQAGGAPQLARAVVEQLSNEETLATFPEGGLETSPGLREFNLGVFQIAAESNLVIQPVVLRGTREALPWPRLVPQSTRLKVEFGPALRPTGQDLAAAVELSHRARQWIGERCGEPVLQQRLRRES